MTGHHRYLSLFEVGFLTTLLGELSSFTCFFYLLPVLKRHRFSNLFKSNILLLTINLLTNLLILCYILFLLYTNNFCYINFLLYTNTFDLNLKLFFQDFIIIHLYAMLISIFYFFDIFLK